MRSTLHTIVSFSLSLIAACGAPRQLTREAASPRGSAPQALPDPRSIPESVPCADAVAVGNEEVPREHAPADVSAIPSYAHVNPSGLGTCVVRPGIERRFPRADDRVTVRYVGWSTAGVMFDSALVRARPATFPLRAVIAGWTEGVGMMTPGEVRRLWIPVELAYQGRPGRPPGMLVFDIELLRIEPPEH